MTGQTTPSGSAVAPGQGRRAADRANDRNSLRISIPLVGAVNLPPADELSYLGGVGLLAVAGFLEWPVAGILAAGHLLASNRNSKALRDFGQALEEV